MKKIIFASLAALALGLSSCDSYLDINNNPNALSEEQLTAGLIFPGVEMAFANVYGDYMRTTGGYFAQHYAQFFGTGNYVDYSQFKQASTKSDRAYQELTMHVLNNAAITSKKAEAEGDRATMLACAVLRAATYQALVDCYGEMPYSEAMDISNTSPKYDEGKDIYAGIIKELDNALEGVSAGDLVCTNFLFPDLTAAGWIKTANALKLRILMRESNAVDVKSQLAALVAENNFPTSDVCWAGCWTNQEGSANPFFTEDAFTTYGGSQKNIILNAALAVTMSSADDPRLNAWFDPNGEGKYLGGVSGTNFSVFGTAGYGAQSFCRPVMYYNSPVYFITVAETEFFLAEYEARYGSASAAKAHYEAAIQASFDTAGVSDTSTVLTAYPWDTANYKKCIGIQKWVHLSGMNSYEAWCEMRRLGYPAFGSVSGADIYDEANKVYSPEKLSPGTLYTPYQVNSNLGSNQLLQRWPYPESSTSRNMNAPKAKGDTTPIFWAQ